MTDGLRIRSEEPGDHAAVQQLICEAFEDEVTAQLANALRGGAARASLVAVKQETVVGHVLISRGWIDSRKPLYEVAILSPLAVHPGHRRQGIGERLVRAALQRARELGFPMTFLEGSPHYYARFEFVPAASLGFVSPSLRIPPASFQVHGAAQAPDREPGTLIYPEAFWAWDAVGLRDTSGPG